MDDILRAVLRLQEIENDITANQYQLYVFRLFLEILYFLDINILGNLTIRGPRSLNAALRINVGNLRDDLEEYLTWNEHEEEIYFRED